MWSDAVVVGAGTQAADDPLLTARGAVSERQPLRVVVDRGLALRGDCALVASLSAGPVLAVCGSEVTEARRAEVAAWGVDIAVAGLGQDGALDPLQVGRLLVSRDVQTVLLEGGPRLAGAWWSAGLIDKVAAFVCPRIVSGVELRGPLRGLGAPGMDAAVDLQEVEVVQVGPDTLITGYRAGPF